MSLGSLDSFFILLEEKFGKRRDGQSQLYFNPSSKKGQEILPGGTLLRLLRRIPAGSDQGNEPLLLLERLDIKDVQVTCRQVEVESVSWEIPYIASILTLAERLEVFKDKQWLNIGKKLKQGDSVYVKIKDEQVEGTVRFKGEVPDAKGIIFGVELSEKKGISDGMYKESRYFRTSPYRAIFTPLNKIQIRRDGWSSKSRLRADEYSDGLYKPEQSNDLLKLGTRVVWISDDGPQKGTVRWCGVLPNDASDNITVGVEFDEPIGTGTGKYKDTRLFYTRQNFASLIPLMGLMKEEDHDPYQDIPSQIKQFNDNSADFITQQQQILEQYHKKSHPPPPYDHPETKRPTEDMDEKSSLNFNRRKPLEFNESHFNGENSRLTIELKLNDAVEVKLKDPLYGIIRWIGQIHNKNIAGLEMENDLSGGTDGTYMGQRYFHCPPKKALFVPLIKCIKDRRSPVPGDRKQEFGGEPTPEVDGDIPPAEITSDKDYMEICGKHRGIQGHHNSCYLDASLFCMFYFTTVFDFIFNRPSNALDLLDYPKVQKVLREKIVNPLRKFHYVRADNVLELRDLLDKLGTVPGMMGEEKDPEEFLNALLSQIMKADPLLHLSSGEHSFFYQLFMEKDENLLLPTTQKLVELSFLQGNVKLKKVPSCLMIQMPRFGKDFKMFHRIVPSLQLDITHILENRPRDCIVCGGLAMHECKDCYQVHGPGLNTTAFCDICVKKSHQHQKRRSHKPEHFQLAPEVMAHYTEMKRATMLLHQDNNGATDAADNNLVSFPREVMELFAVICIQTSHYVSFVKCGSGKHAPWVFFDSMADRKGEQGGYNIPEVVHVPEISKWLSESNVSQLQKGDDKDLPEHLRRLLCDGYMCMYQSPTVMMFQ